MKNENMPKDMNELFIKEYLELKDENRNLKELCERDEELLETERERYAEAQGVLNDIIEAFGIHLDAIGSVVVDETVAKDEEAKGIADYLKDHFGMRNDMVGGAPDDGWRRDWRRRDGGRLKEN